MPRTIPRAALAVLLCGVAAPLTGQGSSVYTQSSCANGRADAAVATPCNDGSSVYFNPALLAVMPSTVSAGFAAIYNEGNFTYDTTGVVVEREATMPIVPQLYASYRFGRFAAGFGFFAPYGLGIEWPETFEGRFISWKTDLQGIYLQPTVAYEIIPDRLAIGGGVDIVLGGIELNQNIDGPVADDQLAGLGIPLGTDIGSARLEGTGTGYGGHVGVYWRPTERLALGARYMFPVTLDLEGDADFEAISNPNHFLRLPAPTGGYMTVPLDNLTAPLFEAGAALSDQGVTASLTLPPQGVVGFKLDVTRRLALSGDYQWTGWSTFDELVASFDGDAPDLGLVLNYNDAHTFRSGLTYALSEALEARAGAIYNTAATPDETVTPILPEAERQQFTAGLGYRMGRLQTDVFYYYIDQADRRGRVRSELPPSLVTETGEQLNVGVYSTTLHLVGLTVSWLFGETR